MTKITLTPTQQKAFDTIQNLRRLTQETGTRTTFTQNEVLRALNPDDLVAVTNALYEK